MAALRSRRGHSVRYRINLDFDPSGNNGALVNMQTLSLPILNSSCHVLPAEFQLKARTHYPVNTGVILDTRPASGK